MPPFQGGALDHYANSPLCHIISETDIYVIQLTYMNGYVENIEKLTLENENFRKVLYTDKNSQLVLMSLLPNEEIGEEIHDVDQFLRIEAGQGKTILNDISHELSDGSAIIVPAGTKHNIINTGKTQMKLYSLYMPPHHKDGIVHKTKAEAEKDKTDEFDGRTTE
jgi:mannose-6-phosphate isomerase-like protein (cupin superfamily)